MTAGHFMAAVVITMAVLYGVTELYAWLERHDIERRRNQHREKLLRQRRKEQLEAKLDEARRALAAENARRAMNEAASRQQFWAAVSNRLEAK